METWCGLTHETKMAWAVALNLGRQHLDSDVTIQLRIARPVYFAHPARAKWGDNLIRPELGASGECARPGQLQNLRRGCAQKLTSGLLVSRDQRLHFRAHIGIRSTR